MRKIVDRLAKSTCSNCLTLTELTRLDEPKCLFAEKLPRLGASPYHRKRVTRKGETELFASYQTFA